MNKITLDNLLKNKISQLKEQEYNISNSTLHYSNGYWPSWLELQNTTTAFLMRSKTPPTCVLI